MKKIRIRPIEKTDIESLYIIDQVCFPPEIAYSKEYFEDLLRVENIEGLSVEKDGDMIGFILAVYDDNLAEIVTIDILPEYRKKGYGSLLMKTIEEFSFEKGIDSIFLQVAESNNTAIKFYKELNYEIINEIPDYYPDGTKAFLMSKKIK